MEDDPETVEVIFTQGELFDYTALADDACSKQIVIEQFTRRRHGHASDALHEVEVHRLLGAACPHIVRFAGAHVADGALHILTEYAENGSLRQLLDRRRDRGEVLGEAEALDLFVQLVSGVRHLHAHKVVHRDIKPGNIFLDRRNLVRLGDFGIARVLGGAADDGAQPQRSVGTPLPRSAAAAGSETTILQSGRACLRTLPTPCSVPPVPYPVTQ